MRKKRIVHVIDDLSRGGAETTLVDLLPDLHREYELILVTLSDRLEFDAAQIVCAERISLGYRGPKDIWTAARRLRKIIRERKPDLVRCQLFYSTIVTRLACPRRVPLFFSVHATMNEDPIAPHKRLFLNALEKFTYRPAQTMIGVTQAVIDSFARLHPRRGRTFLLHNFVRNEFFARRAANDYDGVRPLRLVTVGNLRLIKNMPYLLQALRDLPRDRFTLDIYGEGPVRTELEAGIREHGLTNVHLRGRRNDIYNVLADYDVFLSPSTVEGFGIAVAEAMAVGLPVIISDIPVYREIGGAQADYLDPRDPATLAVLLRKMEAGAISLAEKGEKNRIYAEQLFSKGNYLSKLHSIYQTNLQYP